MSGLRWGLVLMLVPGVFAMALSGAVFAQTAPPDKLMSDANGHYERGEYAGAVQLYESLVGQGYRDAAIYYNLANAYVESGDLGRSILNYLRAEELSPRDPDILFNLDLARSRSVDRLEAEGDSLVASVADFGRRWATTFEFGLAALLLWISAGAGVCALILRPHIRRRGSVTWQCRTRPCAHGRTACTAVKHVVFQSLRKHGSGYCYRTVEGTRWPRRAI